MASNTALPRSSSSTGQKVQQGEPSGVVERITVALSRRVGSTLGQLRRDTGDTQTDIVNRAISLYGLVQDERSKGYELAFYDPKKDRVRPVHILD